jgi:hypothetical protein
MKYATIILVASILLTTPTHAAEFSREMYGNFGYLTITGEIIEGDFNRFKQIAPKGPADWIQIKLDSPGGRTNEGVAIGRYIFEHRLDTTVFRYCASAWSAPRGVDRRDAFQLAICRARSSSNLTDSCIRAPSGDAWHYKPLR